MAPVTCIVNLLSGCLYLRLALWHAQRRLPMPMSLVRVDSSLLDLHGVDEDESEAVALCLVELLFAETNAFYRQHCLAKQAVASTAALLTSSVFDAVASSQLRHENDLDARRFTAESSPIAEINDRHAARCIPNRSPDKPGASTGVSTTLRTRAESRIGDRTRMSLAYKRRGPDKKLSSVAKPTSVTIPQAIALPEVAEEEDPDDKAWRIKCLKELNGDTSGPKRLSATSKWMTFTRQLPVVEPSVALEVEIIDSASPLLRQEVSGAASANAVRMKSSLNTFSSVSTTQLRTGSAASSVASRKLSVGGSRSLTGSQSVPALGTAPRKASSVQLNDNLSRKRSTIGGVPHSPPPCPTAENDPWQFELQEWTPRETMRTPFVPDMMVASAAAIPSTISLAAGVEFMYGDAIAKGPERRESDHTMSRKRFELHQRLATDHLLQESALLQQPVSPSSHTSSGSKSPLSTHHKQPSPRPYETVPPDPVPTPSLSPIAKGALVIPRNHLTQSASTPSLRVRQPSVHKRADVGGSTAASTHPLVTNEELEAIRKARPSTALGAVVVKTPRQRGERKEAEDTRRPKTSSASTSKRDASSKYLREFPKPHAGSVKVNPQKAALLDPVAAEADSARQRLAWIS